MRYRQLFLIAIASGIYLSVMYVNPYGGVALLSETVLQLSGSRGSFVLGFSYSELAAFGMRLFPGFIFELYAGIMLYRHFCTASIYVFSRYPHRVKWYMKEAGRLGGAVCIFHALLLATTLLTTALRYEWQIDHTGVVLLVYHFLIHSLWVYTMTILVNLLAIHFGSSTAYALVISAQLVCIVLLNVMDVLVERYDGRLSYEGIILWNPLAHLVLGWHNPTSSYMQVDLKFSLIVFFLLGIIITSIGAFVIKEYDLLVSDLETEVA
jgi:hypothetical protein